MQIDVDRMLETLHVRQLVPDTCQAIYVVGSAARGWSNKRSDVDICVISSEPWPGPETVGVPVLLQPSVVQWHTFHAAGRGWDVAYWLDGQVDQMLAKVSWSAYDRTRASSDDVLAPREEVFLGRIVTCAPLFGEDWLERRRAEIDASAYKSILVTRSLGSAGMAVEDALGQMENGDLHSAVLSARNAFGHVVDALLAERGEFECQITKWRARRFQEAGPAALSFARYWAIETMRDFDPGEPDKWVSEILTLCQDLSLKIDT